MLFPDTGFVALKLKAGRFNWSSPYDQIAWMSSTFDYGTRLSVLTVDPVSPEVSRKADIPSDVSAGIHFLGYDIAVGNFDACSRAPRTRQAGETLTCRSPCSGADTTPVPTKWGLQPSTFTMSRMTIRRSPRVRVNTSPVKLFRR